MSNQQARAQFYEMLATLLEAGVPALQAFGKQSYPSPFKKYGRKIAEYLEEGNTITQAFQKMSSAFSPVECAIIMAGEQSGNITNSFRELSLFFTRELQLRRSLRGGFIYPLFLYHIAGPLLCLIQAISSNQSSPSETSFIFLVKWFAFPWLILLLWKIFRPLLDTTLAGLLLTQLPFIGSWLYQKEMGQFLNIFAPCLNAGLSPADAIAIAANTCENTYYIQQFQKIALLQMDLRGPVTELLAKYSPRPLPDEILSLLQTGEQTGKLPEFAQRSANLLMDDVQKKRKMLVRAIPMLFYLGLVCFIAMQILSFFSGYTNSINELLQ